MLLERADTVVLQSIFLQRQVNFNNIAWFDETWVNATHSHSTARGDDLLESTTPVPTSQGGILIKRHAGTAEGFVNEVMLHFKFKKAAITKKR